MKLPLLISATFALGLFAFQPAVHAEECTFNKAQDEFEQADVERLYDCVKDSLAEGYGKEGHAIGANYRSWKVTATRPADPGPHSERFLLTFANDIAYGEYVKWRDEGGFSMPVGSILAKESYKLNKEGKAAIGPLLIMTKLKAGEAPEYGDWLYTGVNPAGKEFEVSQKFCHDCHSAYEHQDFLGYPVEDVRVQAAN